MATPSHLEFHRTAWNGVAIMSPFDWQAKVNALQHLIFEKNAKAVMEMRWQKSNKDNIPQFIDTLTRQHQKLTGKKLGQAKIPPRCQELFRHCEIHCFAEKYEKMPLFVFLYETKTSLFLMLKFYEGNTTVHPLQQIQSIDFSIPKDDCFLWSIQDFQVCIPLSFQLSKYTMKAGLTVLQFIDGKKILNICRLALAQKRLEKQELAEIFYSLLGEEKPLGAKHVSESTIRHKESPGLLQQLSLRFQRRKPFKLAAFWQDQENDRLLGVFIEDIKPIDEEIFEKICQQYEIFKIKNN